jgi:mono/diheme cytochrome c family protein
MTVHSHTIAAVALAGAMMTCFGLAQGAVTPSPQGQQPAGQTPSVQGRGGDPGQRGAAPPQGRQGGRGRAGGYTQFTRPLAPEDVIVRGKALYETNCASCHAPDLRGTADGKNPNLLRSGAALRDQKGALIAARLARHNPPINLIDADAGAIADYIHSVHATMGGQGSPPGRIPTNVTLNVLVGNATRPPAISRESPRSSRIRVPFRTRG